MTHQRALVTITLGDGYGKLWQHHVRPNWETYAARHHADVIAFDEPLDTSPRAVGRKPSWQKLLILEQPQMQAYKQVVWLDADILLHPQAEWIGEGISPELVGAVDEYAYPTPELHHRAMLQLYRFWQAHNIPYANNPTAETFYTVGGYPQTFDRAVQVGMLVLSPPHHREILRYVYDNYTQTNLAGLAGEMRPLSYELVRANLVQWMPTAWHAIWSIEKQLHYPFLTTEPAHPFLSRCVTKTLCQNNLLHFAGLQHELVHVHWDDPALTRPPAPRVYPVPVPVENSICETPVALILFNRPETTARVMQAIRQARPRHLFLVADGPRGDVPPDIERCAQARAVALGVDWDCEIHTHFADTNLGLKKRVESGLDWVFENVERAIILEDDCLPQPTFFPYCDELLERYAHDPRIMTISGCDYKFGLTDDSHSYTFSRYPLIWGWATWRRAWQLHDSEMRTLPHALATGRVEALLGDRHTAQYWEYLFNRTFQTKDTWDYGWVWSSWEHQGLSIHPNTNLVENIGFGQDASHTLGPDSAFSEMLTLPMQFPLSHPPTVERSAAGDEVVEEIAFSRSVRRVWEHIRAARSAFKARKPTPA